MPDATPTLNEMVGALENMANLILMQVGEDRAYNEIWGWNQPAVGRQEVAALIRSPKDIIASINQEGREVSPAMLLKLTAQVNRINYVSSNTVPNLPGSNANLAYATIKSLIDDIRATLSEIAPPKFDIDDLERRELLPAAQARRLRGIDRATDKLMTDSNQLRDKIALINDAHAAAEALPTDLQMLKEGRRALDAALQATQTNRAGAETARGAAERTVQLIEGLREEAVKLVQGTENAFSAATTKGLGEDFGARAEKLEKSVWILGGVLAATLVIGAVITYYRLNHINDLLSGRNFSMQVLWAHVVLSIASIAAPVWFGWLLTKQIGQRFRLAEDYAFKASVAKAYAGYSAEAARVDPEFQKRLYSTALNRIDEEPLRYVETDNHGSPLHELFSKQRMRRAAGAAAEELGKPKRTDAQGGGEEA